LRRVLGPRGQNVADSDIERGGDAAQQDDGDVPVPGFELSEVALGHVRFPCQEFARQPAPLAQFAHPFAERREELAIGRREFVSTWRGGGLCRRVRLGIYICCHIRTATRNELTDNLAFIIYEIKQYITSLSILRQFFSQRGNILLDIGHE